MSAVGEAIQQLRTKLSGEQLQLAQETLEFQMQIYGRQLAGEDTAADEAKVRAITANLTHATRRQLEDVWFNTALKTAKNLFVATMGA